MTTETATAAAQGHASGSRTAAASYCGDDAPRTTAAELALAAACDRQDEAAWERLMRCYRGRLLAVLHMRRIAPVEAQELVAELWGELALPPRCGTARTRIGAFQGASSLATFLVSILVHRHADRARRHRSAGCVDPACACAAATDDPHLCAVAREEGRVWEQALARAFHALLPREALALALRHGDGLPLGPIALRLGVGVPRASRILQRALRRLREALCRTCGPRRTQVAAGGAEALRSFLAGGRTDHGRRPNGGRAGKSLRPARHDFERWPPPLQAGAGAAGPGVPP